MMPHGRALTPLCRSACGHTPHTHLLRAAVRATRRPLPSAPCPLAAQRLGDSGVHQKSVASATESELAMVASKVGVNKGKMIDSLLQSVTTVGL